MADNIPEFTKDNSLPLDVIDDEKGIVEGYASVFGVIDSQGDIVEPEAFDHILNDPKAIKKIKFLWQHDYKMPIGKIQKLWKDDIGLKYRAKYNQKTSWGKDAYNASLNEDVDGNSIGYTMRNGKAVKDDEGLNHLLNIGLMEISNVTFPSNQEATHTGVKSELPTDIKPYPNEHACRVKSPDAFESDSFRRVTRDHEGKEYSIIMGRLKGETTMTTQAMRYPKDAWTAEAARAHCDSHEGGSFEAADGKSSVSDITTKAGRVLSARNEADLRKAADLITNVLGQLGATSDESEKSNDKQEEELILKLQNLIDTLKG